jgi:hypothetical protein
MEEVTIPQAKAYDIPIGMIVFIVAILDFSDKL